MDPREKSPLAPTSHPRQDTTPARLPTHPPALHLTEKLAPPPDFDPCQNAKPCSPFYDHDTPRCSTEYFPRHKTSFNVSVRDLEAQNGLTPSASASQMIDRQTTRNSVSAERGGDKLPKKSWVSAMNVVPSARKASQCPTKPKLKRFQWYHDLSKKQRLMFKIFIALLVVGAVVGIGVGISLRTGGGVYKTGNSTSEIGKG